MKPLEPQAGPVPHASSELSVPFWPGCQAGELRYQMLTNIVGVAPEELAIGMRGQVNSIRLSQI